MKASEAKFRNLVENAAAGIVTTLPDGQMLNANKAALQIFGYAKEEELSNKPIVERYADPEDRGRLLQLIKDKGVAKGFEVRMKRKDDTLFWASLNMIVQVQLKPGNDNCWLLPKILLNANKLRMNCPD